MKLKKCDWCGDEKPHIAFAHSAHTSDSMSEWCRACDGKTNSDKLTDELRALLGKINDVALAERAGVSVQTAARWRCAADKPPCRKHSPSEARRAAEPHLTTMSASQIAKMVGVSASAVNRWKRELGIPVNPVKPIAYADLLGKIPDAEIARQHGVTTSAVFQARRIRKIPACGGRWK